MTRYSYSVPTATVLSWKVFTFPAVVPMADPQEDALWAFRCTVYPVAPGNDVQLSVTRAGDACTEADNCTLAASDTLIWPVAVPTNRKNTGKRYRMTQVARMTVWRFRIRVEDTLCRIFRSPPYQHANGHPLGCPPADRAARFLREAERFAWRWESCCPR
jgi:hypothetical protein